MSVRNNILKPILFMVVIIFAGKSYAGTYSMISLYTDIPSLDVHCDCPDMPAPLYLATFTDSSSDNSTDNSTGSASAGTLTLDVEGRNFDNETGTYMPYGIFFTGSWTASEYDYEANRYYDNVSQTIYINYSFIIVGLFIDPLVVGTFFTSTGTTISEPVSSIVPFLGILVSD